MEMDMQEEIEINIEEAQQLSDQLIIAIKNNDLQSVQKIVVNQNLDITYCKENPLCLAAQQGNAEICLELISTAGVQWNTIDQYGKSAGEYAKEYSHNNLYNSLVEQGCMTSMLIGELKMSDEDEISYQQQKHKDYLNSKLIYQQTEYGEVLITEHDKKGVMMGWEKPLMQQHAQIICQNGGDILNVGFGLGIIDEFIQSHNPRSHTIIEAHPDVYKHMIELGWHKKKGVTILFGKWQDFAYELDQYDGIFYDTFGEYYEDQKYFHQLLSHILKPNGIYSYFNGLSAEMNYYFHEVAYKVAEYDLKQIGLQTDYKQIPMDLNPDVWKGIDLNYWNQKMYYLPIITWFQEVKEQVEYQQNNKLTKMTTNDQFEEFVENSVDTIYKRIKL